MANIGAPELIIISLIGLVIAAGIGYWCMRLFQGKGRSGAAGFVMGFLLTIFLSLVGAVVAVLIAYLIGPAAPAGGLGGAYAAGPAAPAPGAVPPPPPPVSPQAQTVATFNASTGWNGRRIVYDGRALLIEGVGVVTPADVLVYAQQAQADWASDAMRAWVTDWAAQA